MRKEVCMRTSTGTEKQGFKIVVRTNFRTPFHALL